MPGKLTLYPPGRVPRFLIVRDGESLEIGRDPVCDLFLEDPRISKHHARLAWTGTEWTIEDLRSKNGTTLNGDALSGAVPLSDGAWLGLGGLPARFEKLTALQAANLDADRLARIRTSADMQRHLTASLEPLDLLGRFVDLALQVAGAERGFLLTLGAEGELRPDVVVGFFRDDLVAPEFLGSVTAVKHVVDTGEPLIVSDALEDPRLRDRPSVVRQGIRLLACLPLRAAGTLGEIIGVVYVDRLTPGPGLGGLDVETLEALAGHTGSLLATCLGKRGMLCTEDPPGPLRKLFRNRLEELLPLA